MFYSVSAYVGLYGSGLFNFGSYVSLPTLFACFFGFDVPTSFIFINVFYYSCTYYFILDSSKEIYLDHISRLDSVSCKEDEPVIKRFKSDNQKVNYMYEWLYSQLFTSFFIRMVNDLFRIKNRQLFH